MTTSIQSEANKCLSPDFVVGQYLYMGMGMVNHHRVCISVGYKIGYCIKKALQFEKEDSLVKFTHINKVKVGEVEACEKFDWLV